MRPTEFCFTAGRMGREIAEEYGAVSRQFLAFTANCYFVNGDWLLVKWRPGLETVYF